MLVELNSAQVEHYMKAFREVAALRDVRIGTVNHYWRTDLARAVQALRDVRFARNQIGATDLKVMAYYDRFGPGLTRMWDSETAALRIEKEKLNEDAERYQTTPTRPRRSDEALQQASLCHHLIDRFWPISRKSAPAAAW
ncbi:hypothetical protein JCM16303_005545 [Sporobolomyces ruberrimus]